MGYVQHLSVRVPWHDSGWNGTVCHNPAANSSCILLKNIGEKRQDDLEITRAGDNLDDLDPARTPCVSERATFMSPRNHSVPSSHPYAFNSALRALQPTVIQAPAWSVHAVPYYWLNAETVQQVLQQEPIDGYVQERETDAMEALGWKDATWILHGDNQQAVIESFFRDVRPEQSLVFFYLKHSPFEDVGRRILVGAALVDDVTLPGRWPTSGPTAFPNHQWETTVRHTMRPDGTGGILLPLQQLAALAETGTDVSAALAVAPESRREFSYVTEHVPADVAVAALLELRRAADAAAEFGCPIEAASLQWLDDQLARTWRRRGPSPGLPAVLARLGWEHPTFAARSIMAKTADWDDPWHLLTAALEQRPVPSEVARLATATRRRIWSKQTPEMKQALRLLARFDLTAEEIDRALDEGTSIPTTPEDLLRNPYDLVTCTIDDDAPIPFAVVDRGCFPAPELAARHALSVEEPFDDPLDQRRVEAALTATVAEAQADGHTLLPVDVALKRLEDKTFARPLPLTAAVLQGLDLRPDDLDDSPEANWPPLSRAALADGQYAYKLRSAATRVRAITEVLDGLRNAPRHDVPTGLSAGLDAILPDIAEHDASDRPAEERAREEKRAALRELFASRFTVLNGPAGTGKTTLIRALVERPEVKAAGVLLLAPTGKARVQLERKVGYEARTLAQFLTKTKRYTGETGRYRPTGEVGSRQRFGTVVIDEASMLTEDMLDALLDALVAPDRLILVGDPRQLPPIGAGRPFVDLERAARDKYEDSWPRVVPGWVELTVLRRQRGSARVRDDLMLARWFSGDELPEGFDEVWHRLRSEEDMETLRAVPWNGRTAAQVMDDVLREELQVKTDDGGRSFAESYGATVGQYINYYDAAKVCERWQVLSPVRGRGHGTVHLNRHLKLTHRGDELEKALRFRNRRVPKPLGGEQIVLGDKVVNLINQRLPGWSRENGQQRTYVANGEIGVVVGQVSSNRAPWATQVEFSSQQGIRVTVNSAVSESDASIELAWALTVHKSQGSEFETVILMLPAGVRGLSRELIYTALTRQVDRIVLCHEGPLDDLLALTRATGSDAARRFTDLVKPAQPRSVTAPDGTTVGTLDERLVHVTANGVLVRSKNEVIIAGILDEVAPGLWAYEQPLIGAGGHTRLPDFTINTPSGRTVYWEHLGMLDDPTYAQAWARKKEWYADQGVLPLDEGGGPNGALICTDDRGGVDVPAWKALAESFMEGVSARISRRVSGRRTGSSRSSGR